MFLRAASSLQATDMDATGLIFWEMTTGKPVLHNDYGSFLNLFQLIAKHLRHGRNTSNKSPFS
jgi:hypothetical protein